MVQQIAPVFIPTKNSYGETTYINSFAISKIEPLPDNKTSKLIYKEGGKDYFTTALNSNIKMSTGLDVNA